MIFRAVARWTPLLTKTSRVLKILVVSRSLTKEDITGNVSYNPENHQHMVKTRAEKVAKVAHDIPPQEVVGPEQGDLLVVSWGGTYGACLTAVQQAQAGGARDGRL